MPISSPYLPLDIPNVDIWDFLFERKDRPFPDDKVIYADSETGRSYTYDVLRSTAIEFGQGLKATWDWKKGDVLALFTPNSIDIAAITWGCHWAGGIVSPANPANNVKELAFQLKDASAKSMATQLSCLATAKAAAERVGMPQDRIILIGDERDESRTFKHFTSIRNISGVTRYRRPRIDPAKALAFLVYSSGTTGYPKGVMLSHRNIVSNILMLAHVEADNLSWNGGPDGMGDRTLAFLPFFHIYGLTCHLHLALHYGFTLVVMAKFDLEKFCAGVQKFKITFAYVVPPVVLQLSKHPIVDKYDMSSLRMFSCGAAPLTKELIHALYRRLKVPIKQGYGLSETSPTTHTCPWEEWDKAIGSVGRLLPNQTAKYISPEGDEVSPGQTGELCIQGPNVFQGYLNNPEGTRAAFTTDGYFRTGDVGYDHDGYFFITDRVKELIKYKGFQVAPAELEGLLASNPKVCDTAVIGVYDRSMASEVPRAYVVLAPGEQRGPETEREIVRWLNDRVANYKWLRGGVRFIDEIPKSASGKILRRVLKERCLKEEERVEDGVLKSKL